LPDIIDIEHLQGNIKTTYSTTEEHLNHKDREVHGLPINEPGELRFFNDFGELNVKNNFGCR
jgi:hypothetical protein